MAAAIPEEALKANQHCLLAVTPAGGHLGWMRRDDLFGEPSTAVWSAIQGCLALLDILVFIYCSDLGF